MKDPKEAVFILTFDADKFIESLQFIMAQKLVLENMPPIGRNKLSVMQELKATSESI